MGILHAEEFCYIYSIKASILRTILLFISFFLITLTNKLSAQDVFELTYQFKGDPTKTIYKGLLVKNTDGTGFLRLTANNNKTSKRVLYDFSITLNPYNYGSRPMDGGLLLTAPDKTTYWYCWSENFNLKEGEEVFDFDYLRLWFRRENAKKIIEPCLKTPFNVKGRSMGLNEEPVVSQYPATAETSENKQQQYGETGILSFKELKNTTFTKAYLKDYFISSELFYEGAYTRKQLLTARNNTKPVLYLISVINSKDEDISVNCIEDGKKVSSYFKRITTSLEIRFVEKKLTGNDFNVTAVRAAIKNTHPGKDDIVVFYYSGHGFRWKGDIGFPFPQMGLYYGKPPSWDHMGAFSINIEDIYKEINAKGARLNLVMSDCCNTIVNRRRSEIIDTAKSQVGPGYYDMAKRAAMALFLQTKASLLISAAEMGQASNCSNSFNSFFTTSMINSIRMGLKTTGPTPQWMDVVRKAEDETSVLASKYKEQQKIIYKVCNKKTFTPCVEDLGGK